MIRVYSILPFYTCTVHDRHHHSPFRLTAFRLSLTSKHISMISDCGYNVINSQHERPFGRYPHCLYARPHTQPSLMVLVHPNYTYSRIACVPSIMMAIIINHLLLIKYDRSIGDNRVKNAQFHSFLALAELWPCVCSGRCNATRKLRWPAFVINLSSSWAHYLMRQCEATGTVEPCV